MKIKKRSIFWGRFLAIITLRIYDIYWYAKFHSELRSVTGEGISNRKHIAL